MKRIAWLLALTIGVACGGASSTPAASPVVSAAAPAAKGTEAARQVVHDQGPPSSPMPEPEPEPEIDAHTAGGAAAFLSAACARAARADRAWITAHVSPTVRGNIILERTHDGSSLQSIASVGVEEVASTLVHDDGGGETACSVLAAPGGAITDFAVHGNESTGVIHGPHDGYRFAITSGGAATQLDEASLDLPPHPMPTHVRKHGFSVDGNPRGNPGETVNVMGHWFEGVIRRAPGCVYEQAARDEVSSAMIVHAVKVDGAPATVRVYASTVVSESLVACLEDQLTRETATLFKGTPFDVDYVLRVNVTITKAVPEGVEGGVMGP